MELATARKLLMMFRFVDAKKIVFCLNRKSFRELTSAAWKFELSI
jgi:hypothetical protein